MACTLECCLSYITQCFRKLVPGDQYAASAIGGGLLLWPPTKIPLNLMRWLFGSGVVLDASVVRIEA
jgi:hypothetical protein